MNLEQYDKWVIANQKKILDWTRKFDKQRYAPIRDAFSNYHNAQSNKQKITSFEKLKDELKLSSGKSFNELIDTQFTPTKELLQKVADDHTKGDIEALDRNSNFAKELTTYDDLSPLYEATSSIPSKEESYDWVELDKAYEDHYNVKELTALAKKYGYDYSDKNERSEFLHKLSEIERQKNVEKAFNVDPNAPISDKIAQVVTDFTLPVSKEYARQNYENINGVSDMKLPLAADLATNVAMFGTPGKFINNPTGKLFVNNVTAPIIREGTQIGINNKSFKDAAIDAGGAIMTNYATPYAMRIPMRWAGRVAQGEMKQGAQDMINAAANKSREISDKVLNGTPVVKVIEKSDGTKSPLYFIFNKNKGKLERVPDHVARNAKNGKTVTWNEYKEWQDIGYTNRNADIHKLNKLPKEDEQHIYDQMKEGAKKAAQNDIEGKDWNSGLNAIEAAGATNINPIETRWNWAKSSPSVSDVKDYITNFQGQTRYATPAINAFAQGLGPLGDIVKVEKDKKLSDSDSMELDMLKRLRELHNRHPELYNMPKLPDKFKDYINEADWYRSENPISIKDIF